MNRTTRFIIDDKNIRNQGVKDIEIQKFDNSKLVIAKRKIIKPDSKIIVDSSAMLSSLQYQPVIEQGYDRTSTGIIKKR